MTKKLHKGSIELINNVLVSSRLQENLEEQVKNLFNLKLEYFFRDQLVIGLNESFDDNRIALAEYPRWKGNRVDVSICKKVDSKFELESMIEMKYQFSGDFNSFKNYDPIFKKELLPKIGTVDKSPEFFILVVADWSNFLEERKVFENRFLPSTNSFNQYQATESSTQKHGYWYDNIEDMFQTEEVESIQKGKVYTNVDHPIDFHYFIVKLK
jgi:hypothetical protein